MNPFQHFTIAHLKHTASLRALLGVCLSVAMSPAFARFDAQTCQAVYQLAPTHAQAHSDATGQWWFTPQKVDTQDLQLPPTPEHLSLSPADTEHFIGGLNDTVLVRWRSNDADAVASANEQPYLIVRDGPPIKDIQGQILGTFTQLIALAQIDSRYQVTHTEDVTPATHQGDSEYVAPLRITQTQVEVDRGDRVLPRMCLNTLPHNATPPKSPATVNQAQVLGFAQANAIGAKSNLILIDQGQAQGVQTGQIWSISDTIRSQSENNSVTRKRGQATILQAFDTYALARINNTEREVARGTTLFRTQATAVTTEPK